MNKVTLVRKIAARPSIVFEAMTTADGIASWWGPDDVPATYAESDPRVGGAYRVRFRTADGCEHEASGEYLEVVAPRRIVMSWRWSVGGEPGEEGRTSRVEFELVAIDSGTELTFTHAELGSDSSEKSHAGGWSGAFDKLVRNMARRANEPGMHREGMNQ